MKKYRFKTREEFIRDGLWDEEDNCPYCWNSDGEMNKYLGKDVPDEHIVNCDEDKNFKYDDWLFQNTDYVLKEQQEYFDDLSQHIGRYIKALVDNPHAGIGVKQGDVGKIISYEEVDFPNRKGYYCTLALNKENLGTRYELLPEDYSPEQETKEPNIEFIPGKWYKLIDCENAYRKCSKIPVEDRLPYSELIGNGSYRCETGSSEDLTRIKLVEDLSEIQEYLPDGHPDKITSSEFKKGEYIVIILKIESLSKDFISNYIYKQREDYKYLRPELDNYSSKTNGWETIGKNNSHNWRYATQEEIDEYERRGKPYDVTELNKQSIPEENITEVPEYIEAIDSFSDYFISEKIYKVKNSNDLTSAVLNCNDLVNFNEYDNLYVNLTRYRWKPSTKEAYEQQKLISVEEHDSLSGISKSDFIFDEVRQYPLTPSECWKNIPKFEEQKEFDIYGPTPDIE